MDVRCPPPFPSLEPPETHRASGAVNTRRVTVSERHGEARAGGGIAPRFASLGTKSVFRNLFSRAAHPNLSGTHDGTAHHKNNSLNLPYRLSL
jgi:hypothetical protein